MKKFATIAGAAALLLGSVAPAMAFGWVMPSYDVNNWANVSTNVEAKADTGDNYQKVYGQGENLMGTGDAQAIATAETYANLFDACGCMPMGDVNNWANVGTNVKAKADTGDNYQKVWGNMQVVQFDMKDRFHHYQPQPVSSNTLWTGNANAMSGAFTVVNAAWTPAN